MSAAKAYVAAGYKPNRFNAGRLKTNEHVAARIADLASAGAHKTEITIERTLREMGKIGFANLRPVVSWKRGKLKLIDSDEISDEMFSAIAEVCQTDRGIRVRMHRFGEHSEAAREGQRRGYGRRREGGATSGRAQHL